MDNISKNNLSAPWTRPKILMAAMFLLGTLIFLPTIRYDFVWDDYTQIRDYQQIKSVSTWPQLLVSKVPIAQTSIFYRPIFMFSYALDYALYKDNPGGYHFTSALLHGLASALLAYLAWLLFQNPYGALAAGALFALHPAHPETVAFISGRADLLTTIFSLLTLIFLAKNSPSLRSPAYILWAPLFFLLSLLSKETAVVLLIPMALLLYQMNRKQPQPLRHVGLKLLPAGLMLIPYLILRHLAVGITSTKKLILLSSPFFSFELFLRYLSFLVFPFQRTPYLKEIQASYPLDAKFWLLALATLFLMALIIYIIYRRPDTILYFALLLLPCLPGIYVALCNDHIMMERYLYLPSAGITLLAGWAFLQVPTRAKKIAVGGLILILAAYGGATLWRAALWQDGEAVFTALKKENPSSAFIRSALGEAYLSKNKYSQAYEELSWAIKLNPYDPINRGALGNLHLRLGMTEKAREIFNEVLKIDANQAFAWEGLGSAYMQEGDYETALQCYDKALQLDPQRGSAFTYKQRILSKRKP